MPIDYIPYLRKMVGHSRVLTVGLCALIVDEKGRILLEKRRDNGLYCLPGGSLDLDEKLLDGLKREILEETGIKIEEAKLLMISSGPSTRLVYPNGDVTEYVDFAYLCHVNGDVHMNEHDDESVEVFFAEIKDLPNDEQLLRGTRKIIDKYLSGDLSLSID
ncbi:MAG: NUDIX domain-containing protein [Bacilli bacterium]|jgi:8-oxo-dGTP pyrophosphatase MutT (NUDIX family)|nr:NUDIX domain-containing protein [Bacilli bacterium]MCI2055323.1 NUDIX domain-containing protein [Bacilli bacterium]